MLKRNARIHVRLNETELERFNRRVKNKWSDPWKLFAPPHKWPHPRRHAVSRLFRYDEIADCDWK